LSEGFGEEDVEAVFVFLNCELDGEILNPISASDKLGVAIPNWRVKENSN
jgi:hypothetical protein